MSAKTNDTLFLAAGGLALAGSCAWAFFQQSTISTFLEPVLAPSNGSVVEVAPLAVTSPVSRQWGKPEAQTAGANWLFEVFTPPVIYYNTETKQFTVTVPVITRPEVVEGTTPEQAVVAQFGLGLVKVVQPLFRLQLVGYVGEGTSARGNFQNELTGDIIFGTTGKKLPDLNLEIIHFSAERVRTPVADGTVIVETVVKATVKDTITGEEIPLDAKVRRPEGPLQVTFKKADGTEVTAKSGDVITSGANIYTVGAITLDPPSAVVTKTGGDLAAPLTETLVIPPPAPAIDPAMAAPGQEEGMGNPDGGLVF
ncbi:MAG: hypothetical protein MUE42_00590 [Opitutaceae bacterium]|nr:hypothetical protein [Opitutaceae bacterium]